MQQLQRRLQQAHTGGAPRVQCRPSLPTVRCRAAAPADTASKTVADLQTAIISLSGSKYGHDLSDDARKQVCGCMQSPSPCSPCRASAGMLEQQPSGFLDPLFRQSCSAAGTQHFASRPVTPGCHYSLGRPCAHQHTVACMRQAPYSSLLALLYHQTRCATETATCCL
jgi:hypothetical protein